MCGRRWTADGLWRRNFIGIIKIIDSAKIARACERNIFGISNDNKKRYSKMKIKERIIVETSDLPPIFKKRRVKYIVRKTVSMAMIRVPKAKPEKKSKNTAAIIT